MRKPLVYLAGAMEKAGKYGSVWRAEITPHLEELGYAVWNPYEEEQGVGIDVKGLSNLKYSDFNTYRDHCQRIVDYDIEHLKTCSLVVCRLDWAVQLGAGTYGELTVCREHKIPVYAWIDREKGKFDIPGWAMGCLTAYTTNKSDFYAMIPSPENI